MWHARTHLQMLMAAGLFVPLGAAAAQHTSTAPAVSLPSLGAADYARWETLGNGALSPDGKWVAYDLRRGDGTTELHFRAVGSADEHTARSGSNPQFSHDSRWLIYSVAADTVRRGGNRGARAGGAAAPASHDKVAIVELATGRTTTLDDIQSFELSGDGSHVALRRYGVQGRRGTDVIVRELAHGTDVSFGNVADLAWSDDGRLLAMTIDVDGHTGNGVQLLDVSTGTLVPLDASDDEYRALAWRDDSHDLVVLRTRPDSAFADTSYTAIAWRDLGGRQSRQVYDFAADQSFPKTMRVTAYRAPEWSENGAIVYLGVAPRDPKIVPVRLAPGELPPARVEVWHWKDLREFHQQQVQGAQDRSRTTLAAWHVGPNTLVRLGDDPTDIVQLSEDRSTVLASDENPYVREIMSGRSYRDVYRVDPATGQRTKLLTKSAYGATLSPSGKHVLYQQDGHWYALDLASGARTDLTGTIKSTFVDVEDDHPVAERRSYGVGGFTTDDRSAILYDRFDAWLVNLDGSNATRLTRGREDSTVYRCVTEGFGRFGRGGGRGGRGGAAANPSAPCQPGNEGSTIDPSKPLLFTATGEYDKKSGYARVTIGQPAQRLVWLDKQVSRLAKADNADVYLMEEQTAEESPNYFVAGANLGDAKPVSNTNAFQHEFAWGKQVLMPYTNKRGDKLQMMLTYPADYQPGKKYPMVVYYYEKLSQGFHQYVVPNLRNPYNTSVFSQNGYFVLRPDIVFQARNPGYSGLDCVTSAVAEVEKRVPDIDAAHVGNMGHSWGGYQSAFYAVHNHGTFAATIAGAPLTDLISMYGYTSGNSGLPETGHYETSQERMQVPLWSDPQAYIRNSTVYSVDSLHTPLLLEEGDADGNVNHFQSEELYNFGRRLGKEVVYLVYEGENHNVARPESQADYLQRQLEWFGHYLKGEPAADWIENGETYLARQRILEAAKEGESGGAPALQAGRARRP